MRRLMSRLSGLFGNKYIHPVLPGDVEPAAPRHPGVERQLDANEALMRSYIPRAERSIEKTQRHYADAAASLLRR